MKPTGHGCINSLMSARGLAASTHRKWILVRAPHHPCRLQDKPAHERREIFTGDVGGRELQDGDAAARVQPARTGERVIPNGGSIRRPRAVEKLRDRRNRRVERISGKSPHGEPRRMREQPPRRHLLALGEFALGEMPRLEQSINVGVERYLAILGETQESAGKYWFADRAGEE